VSSPRIIKLRADGEDQPVWAPDAIDAAASGWGSAYLASTPAVLEETAHERAARIIAQGQAEALERIEAARAEAGRIHAEARDRGLKEALDAAQERADRLAAELRARFDAQVAEINREREEFFSRVEPEMAALAVSVAEKVVAQEIATQPEIVLNLVRNSMKRMKERETLRVRLNPEDLELVRQARDDLIAAVDGVQRLELIEDRRVDRGGCIVESRNGNLDARIKTQLTKMERVIAEAACEEQGPTAHGDGTHAEPVPLPTAGEPDRSGPA